MLRVGRRGERSQRSAAAEREIASSAEGGGGHAEVVEKGAEKLQQWEGEAIVRSGLQQPKERSLCSSPFVFARFP